MKGRLWSVGGVVAAVVIAVVWLGGLGRGTEAWPPPAEAPGNVVVWGETWTYAPWQAPFRNDVDDPFDPEFTPKRAEAHTVMLVPVEDGHVFVDGVDDVFYPDHVDLEEMKDGWRSRFERAPGGSAIYPIDQGSPFAFGMADPETAEWPSGQFDTETGRFALETPPGRYLMCIVTQPTDLAETWWFCPTTPVDLVTDVSVYYTDIGNRGHAHWHVGDEPAAEVQQYIDDDRPIWENRDFAWSTPPLDW